MTFANVENWTMNTIFLYHPLSKPAFMKLLVTIAKLKARSVSRLCSDPSLSALQQRILPE